MKFDLAALRGLSEKNKPRVEAERREQDSYWKAKGEADRRAREEAEYQTAIAGIESKVKWAAQNGERYAKLEDWAPPALNIFQKSWWPWYPKTISKYHLPPVYQRVCDYCQSQGFKVRIELFERSPFKTVYELMVYW